MIMINLATLIAVGLLISETYLLNEMACVLPVDSFKATLRNDSDLATKVGFTASSMSDYSEARFVKLHDDYIKCAQHTNGELYVCPNENVYYTVPGAVWIYDDDVGVASLNPLLESAKQLYTLPNYEQVVPLTLFNETSVKNPKVARGNTIRFCCIKKHFTFANPDRWFQCIKNKKNGFLSSDEDSPTFIDSFKKMFEKYNQVLLSSDLVVEKLRSLRLNSRYSLPLNQIIL